MVLFCLIPVLNLPGCWLTLANRRIASFMSTLQRRGTEIDTDEVRERGETDRRTDRRERREVEGGRERGERERKRRERQTDRQTDIQTVAD